MTTDEVNKLQIKSMMAGVASGLLLVAGIGIACRFTNSNSVLLSIVVGFLGVVFAGALKVAAACDSGRNNNGRLRKRGNGK